MFGPNAMRRTTSRRSRGTTASPRYSRLGYVPIPPGFLTGGELWALCAASRRCASPTAQLIDQLGLDELRALALDKLSLGQRRRACLGAAFLGPPQLLVLDEPDNGLDAKHLTALVTLVKQHAADGGACILASHDAALLDELGARLVSGVPEAVWPRER